MKSLENNKSTVIAVIVFIFAIIAYKYFFAATFSSVDTQSTTAETVGNDVLALQSKLGAVTFDTSLFTTPAYRSLVDFHPTLPVEQAGRINPFAPLGQ